MDNTRLICLRVYSDPQEAHLAACFLRSYGIDCAVTGDEVARTLSWYGLAVKKVELLVFDSNEEAARVLLDEYNPLRAMRKDEQWGCRDELDWVCDKCDENNASTFDECWSCGSPAPKHPERCPGESELPHVAIGELSGAEHEDASSPYRSLVIHTSRIELLPQHELVRRVVRGTIISLVFPPLAFYNLVLIRRVFEEGRPPRRVYGALAANGLLAGLFIVFIGAIIRDLL